MRILVPLLIPALPVAASAQELSPAQQAEVVTQLRGLLERTYVLPEYGQAMSARLALLLDEGAYRDCLTPAAMAAALQRDLRAVYDDKHLRVRLADPGQGPGPLDRAAEQQNSYESARWQNFGFERLERLAGNVGYLDFREFMAPEVARPTAIAAMQFLAGTSALIIDLRRNGGGHPGMVALLSSYLFGAERVHLNDIYLRPEDRTEEFWTDPNLPGPKFGPEKPVYVLISSNTFSGAEEFAYNLQALQRATLIGETTGGGAHPVMPVPLGHGLLVTLPFARAVNPITKTNWEAVGVKPDVAVAADQALATAHEAALRALQARERDPQRRQRLAAIESELQGGTGRD